MIFFLYTVISRILVWLNYLKGSVINYVDLGPIGCKLPQGRLLIGPESLSCDWRTLLPKPNLSSHSKWLMPGPFNHNLGPGKEDAYIPMKMCPS
jgi:hypothetical protein